MIHPDTALRYVNKKIGRGVFALCDIPAGTIVVVKDCLDIVIDKKKWELLAEPLKSMSEIYMYHNYNGDMVLSWDHAKYINHSCNSNTMMTAYGFEIAVEDIKKGEELTTEYGLLNVQEGYELSCGCDNCRKVLSTKDLDNHFKDWDFKVLNAVKKIKYCDQPLWSLLDTKIKHKISDIYNNEQAYLSVLSLKWNK